MTKIQPYAKAAVAVLGALVTALIQAFPDNPDVTRWATFVSTILTAVAVYVVPNTAPTDAGNPGESPIL